MSDSTIDRRHERLSGIEGLRAVAACSILFYHCWLFSSPAHPGWNLGPVTAFVPPLQSGVTLFFVLSGFLLYRPIVARVYGGERPSGTGRYLWNRALRILPAYWLVLLVSGFVLGTSILGRGAVGFTIGGRPDLGLLGKDLLLVGNYAPSTMWTGVLPAWSLTIEVAFYLLLPLLALLAYAIGRRGRSAGQRAAALLAPVALLVFVSIVGKLVAAFIVDGPARSQASDWHTVLDRSILTHADLFAFGMLVAILRVHWERGGTRLVRVLSGGAAGRLLLYAGVPFGVFGYYLTSAYVYDGVMALFLACLLGRVVVPRPAERGRRRLEHPVVKRLGLISYSIFLWNYPVLTFMKVHGALLSSGGATAVLVNTASATLVVLVASLLSYHFVEAPFLRMKSFRIRRGAPSVAVEPG